MQQTGREKERGTENEDFNAFCPEYAANKSNNQALKPNWSIQSIQTHSNLHVLNFVARANFNCAGYDILDHEYVNERSENSDAARQEIYVFHVRILIIVHY